MTTILESQRSFTPEVAGTPVDSPVVVIGGMGGSALPALILRFLGASPYVIMHRDYGLPAHLPAGASLIAVSYSGDTEETVSFAREALERSMPLSVVASGGVLLALAKEHGLPYVEIPSGMVPRDAIVATTKALLALMNEPIVLDGQFDSSAAEEQGALLADELSGSVPVFYSSVRNEALSYIAKIQCNETAKIPAFSNVFPEVNHNEMQGFGSSASSSGVVAVFIRDHADDTKIAHRMDLTESLLREQGTRTLRIELPAGSRAETFLYGWWLMRSAARALAEKAGLAPDATPLIDSFKRSL